MRPYTKKIWTYFTENLGTTIIHPHFSLLKLQREVIDEVKTYLKSKGRTNLVDIGCGRMPYRSELEPLVSTYIGVDHPEVSKLYPGSKPEILADAKKLPFKENSFDMALLLKVLEHVDSPEKVIKEASRVLKPNGVLIISVPFFYPLHDMPHDFGRYTESALRYFISCSNLRLVKIKTQGSFLRPGCNF